VGNSSKEMLLFVGDEKIRVAAIAEYILEGAEPELTRFEVDDT
jgi:hypothetical protein